MEAENQQLKHALTQKTSQVKTLESRLTSTQLDLQESQEKVKRPQSLHVLLLLLFALQLLPYHSEVLQLLLLDCLQMM